MAHTTFPSNIPKPVDDGACNHLPNTNFPSISLPSTSGSSVDISTLPGLKILFCYPRTASPNEEVPESWNQIPGARGCTPQACSFRDLSKELLEAGGGLRKGLELPTMEWEGKTLIKRLSMVVEDGLILKVFYPVFPPDRSAGEVLEWLQTSYRGRKTLSTEAENETMRNLQM
ncbi:uncharacterized protein MYCFIDRAFT_196402 [Pseudocercospora fijiensis CIRAD86]|uniref:Redoxin domain-containing protein n=1 Tax=Pseudocercospora fijiensis (strain CIRAD86) TaxID=383855 RepID=M3AEH8_PSEFD|nr:uncharacterized protein MYCFIDRAFT_196402 [Pseudocercospora fijiensis CIRAD86]EME83001.1 hypothetical protein MYCFIDRAFT_196402 [Pseudocercospora fijiensis CIRAD86]